MMRNGKSLFVACLIGATGITVGSSATTASAASAAINQDQAISKAIDFLRVKGQAEDGSFSAAAGPAVTALVTKAVLESGRTAQDPVVAKALKYLQAFVQSDGGIYQPESRHRNYETCVGLMCFGAANADGRYNALVKNAEAFLTKGQWDESENVQPDNIAYGGAGYGQAERPDLSNTHFLLDALKAAGEGEDDEAFKRALVFVSRCQNLESEYNTTEFPAKNPDGGFYYTPAGGGRSMAGNTDNGGLRSYGSMTYAGLKSMIYCGANADDPRVKAAVEWARKHYTLEDNPGMGDAGLYYYYTLFAKALAATKQPTITDVEGKSHDWRKELVAALLERQQPDGSWVNKNARWMEGDPNLVTAYALLALSYARPGAP
ncbi:MAG TPA: prenyltransferase/squalene oxidase repeat-containing protein [Pirellulales bacterium]|jgi:squalene-hopene/tetraprenyl-beta-curcumene cyclase